MHTKMLAWMGSLFLCGCAELWGPLTADNHDNCVVTPGLCSDAETCSPVLERCVPLGDGGTAVCPAVPCASGQSCDVTAGRCVQSLGQIDLLAVRPRTGPLTGLPMVTVEGLAFTSPAEVRFGDTLSPRTTVLASDRIAAEVPAAAAPGLVRVEVSLSSGMRVTKERMFGYAYSQPGFGIDATLDTQMQTAGPVIITDLNNDGQSDVAVAHNTRVSTYFGGPNGPVFRASKSGASTLTALSGRFVAARIDGDSRTDLVLSDPAQGNVLTLLNEGSGQLESPTVTPVGAGLRDIALADVNNDQRVDLLVTRTSPDQLLVFLNNGNGRFSGTPAATIGVGRDPCSLAVGLFDGDTRPDVAVAFCQESEIRVQLNIGGGAIFGPPRAYATQMGRANPRRIMAADMDADQKLDLVVSSSDPGTAGYFSVLLGRGDGAFLAPVHSAADTSALDVFSVADLDADGFPDVVFAPSSGTIDSVRVMRGDGFGGLQGAQKFPVPMGLNANLRSLAVGDLNADGKADIVYTTNTAGVAVLRNTSQ